MIILKRHALQKGCEAQSFSSASVLRNAADAWPTSMYLIRTFASKCGKFRFPISSAVVFHDFIAKIRLFRRRSPDVVAPFFPEKIGIDLENMVQRAEIPLKLPKKDSHFAQPPLILQSKIQLSLYKQQQIMKKSIFSTLVLSAMTLCSCMSEEEMFQPLDNSLATIELNISNNEELNVSTRATVSNDDLSQWYASATKDAESTPVDGITKASDLISKTFVPGSYTFKVASHESLEASLANGGSAGAAYYEASVTQTLVKGVNTLTFNCETAKNSKITVDWSGTNGVEGLTFNNVTATQDSRTYTYNASGNSAFFDAGQDKTVLCTLNYTFNNVSKSISKTINTTAAATNYKLNISANSNGTITTITINYDDTFSDGGTTSVTIDAATGSEATNS